MSDLSMHLRADSLLRRVQALTCSLARVAERTKHGLLCFIQSALWILIQAAAVLQVLSKHQQKVLSGNLHG